MLLGILSKFMDVVPKLLTTGSSKQVKNIKLLISTLLVKHVIRLFTYSSF